MKNLKIYALVILFGLTLFSLWSFMPQESENKILTVRVFEAGSSYSNFDSKIIVVPEVGEPEQYSISTFTAKNYSNNSVSVNNILNKVSKRGYELHSTSSSGDMNVFIHTYTFVKK